MSDKFTLLRFAAPASVTLLACQQIGSFMGQVSKLRKEHKLEPPAGTIGHDCPEDLARAIRAQHNRLEFFPMFLASEWIAAFYFCPFASSAAGAVYLYGSKRYVDGYVESAKGRHEGFAIATRALYALLGMGIAGIGHAVLKEGFGFDILEVAHVRPIMDKIGL